MKEQEGKVEGGSKKARAGFYDAAVCLLFSCLTIRLEPQNYGYMASLLLTAIYRIVVPSHHSAWVSIHYDTHTTTELPKDAFLKRYIHH